MKDFYIGLTTTGVVIGILEVFRSLEKRLMAAFTLAVIPFIYIGFSWHDTAALFACVGGAASFLALAYFGYKDNFMLVVLGLVLHGIWDLLFPFFSTVQPAGYDVFCLTIDFLLAPYFYFRVKPQRAILSV